VTVSDTSCFLYSYLFTDITPEFVKNDIIQINIGDSGISRNLHQVRPPAIVLSSVRDSCRMAMGLTDASL